MNLSAEDQSLVVATRRGKPGALRVLARSLDDRLAEKDLPLDGAVLAWHSVAEPGFRGSERAMAGLRCRLARVVRATTAGRPRLPAPATVAIDGPVVGRRTLTGRRPAA